MLRIPFSAIVATDAVVNEGGIRRSLVIAGGEWEVPLPLCYKHGDAIAGEVTRITRTGRNVIARGYIDDDGLPPTTRLLSAIRAGRMKVSILYTPIETATREHNGTGFQAITRWSISEVSLTPTPADKGTRVDLDDRQPATVKSDSTRHRAYSLLTIKRADDDARTLEGVASTPTTDRMGDVIEVAGVQFKNPVPFLWQHRSEEPIGHATLSKSGGQIVFKAKLAAADAPGRLKDRLDEAWQSIKLGLVRGASIGFRSLEHAYIDGGGIRFSRTEVLEISAVTIAANSEATITAVKNAAGGATRTADSDLSANGKAVMGALMVAARKHSKLSPEAFGRGLAEIVNLATAPLKREIRDLTSQVAKSLHWQGPYESGRDYQKGDVVQKLGTIWVCQHPTSDAPAESRAWRLLVRTCSHPRKGAVPYPGREEYLS